MKRSNRLFIVAGLALAVIAFVAVLLLGSGGTSTPPAPPTVSAVTAAADIPLGTQLTAEHITTADIPVAQAEESFPVAADVLGKVVRRAVPSGSVLRAADFETQTTGEIASSVPAGLRAVAVPLDKVTSVGFLVQPGDYVDVLLAVRDEHALNTENSTGDGLNPVVGPSVDDPNVYENKDGLVNNTTVKVLVQGVQVLTVLRPSVVTDPAAPAPLEEPDLLAVLAVTPQEAELVRFAQLDGNISLLLRSPGDSQAPDVQTSGITLRYLADNYGVLPPGTLTLQGLHPYQPLP